MFIHGIVCANCSVLAELLNAWFPGIEMDMDDFFLFTKVKQKQLNIPHLITHLRYKSYLPSFDPRNIS